MKTIVYIFKIKKVIELLNNEIIGKNRLLIKDLKWLLHT